MPESQQQTNLKNKKKLLFSFFSCRKRNLSYFCRRKYGGTVAQLVEQRTENPRVTGSIPVGTTRRSQTIVWLFLSQENQQMTSHRQKTVPLHEISENHHGTEESEKTER